MLDSESICPGNTIILAIFSCGLMLEKWVVMSPDTVTLDLCSKNKWLTSSRQQFSTATHVRKWNKWPHAIPGTLCGQQKYLQKIKYGGNTDKCSGHSRHMACAP